MLWGKHLRVMRKDRKGTWFPTAIALLSGLVLGLVLGRSDRSEAVVFAGNTSIGTRIHSGTDGTTLEADTVSSRKRPRPADDREIRLSPKQWRMLQEKPSLLEIDLGQCLAWKGIRETPVEDVKGFGPLGFTCEESGDGPDLSAITGFFGLDERQTALLGDALKRFGERIRSVEAETERVEYRGDGTMRFTFPGSEADKRAAFDDLERELHAALGAQDAGRLWVLSSLEKASENAADGIEAKVSFSGEWVSIGLVNIFENITSRANGMRPENNIHGLGPDTGSEGLMRVRHLQHRIDWLRLYSEAEKQAEK